MTVKAHYNITPHQVTLAKAFRYKGYRQYPYPGLEERLLEAFTLPVTDKHGKVSIAGTCEAYGISTQRWYEASFFFDLHYGRQYRIGTPRLDSPCAIFRRLYL